MAKYKVLRVFTDVHTKETYRVDQEINLTKERFGEIEKNLEVFGGGFLKPIEAEKKPENKTAKTSKKKG
ncbi:hypothetical protein IV471_00925 [Enterococcus gallinarum]|uniref:hypothetical protein n=1 Tax=Enterococcus gallinarum TaxID=1353 RepID=UPI001E461792|nr:hypothetical protein [Enterococcus gallinarum]MCD5183857.1 hypothetical protein [Enterococcus gallinarum]